MVVSAGYWSFAQAACSLGAVAVLPLHAERGHFDFTADVNGRPANLIVDTGSFATTLKTSSADKLQVRFSEMDIDASGIGGRRHAYRGTVKHMRIGQMTADNAVVAGLDMLDQPSAAHVDGLFGMNMMAAYDIDLDMAGGHLILFEADGACQKPNVALQPPLYMVPLEYIEHDRAADIEVQIDGQRFRAMVDSGASETVMYRSAALRLGVDLSPLRKPGHGTGQGIGPRPVAEMKHVFGTVQIGDLQIHNMPIGILDQASEGLNIHVGSRMADPSLGETGGEAMLLGADFMQKVHLWISHSSHMLVMQYPPSPSVLPQ